ncbi:BnaC04g18620D [Brassica napus]|uniref:BnaC04g18620D protein n=2 Tax=Brassica TaxID=3705 RepID=A0A078GPZ9_BRANA|nr:BnaC04g18620D [Brassica napus]
METNIYIFLDFCGASDDFEGLKKEWEEFYYAFGHPREGRSEADTMIPRVSSKLSMLVSHTIFSTFGKIRNENDGLFSAVFMDADEYSGDLVSGLYCKIVVQFEKYNDFVNAMKAFCGRSMKKEGTRLKADY